MENKISKKEAINFISELVIELSKISQDAFSKVIDNDDKKEQFKFVLYKNIMKKLLGVSIDEY